MAEKRRDFTKIATAYARGAIRDKARKKHGVMIRQAAQRYLDDIKRAKKQATPFYFDEWHAQDACEFIEKLPHVEGKWDTPTLVLHPSHVFFLVNLFGFRQKESITIEDYGDYHPRRFTSALFAVARKNAKSTLSAAIQVYCLCCEPEDGAQVLSAATSYDQAAIIFKISKAMIDKTPDLKEYFGLETWAKSITRESVGTSFKAIHAKASTQDGLNPSHTALDEIHAHKTPDLLNVLTSAAGARFNPLWLYTTTEGYTNPGPWGELRVFAKRMLAGTFGNTADHFLAVFYALDEANKSLKIKADDEFDSSKWIKANPLMDVNPHLKDAIRKEAIEAKHMPSKLAEFRIKRLNRPASTAEGWIDLTAWAKCGAPVNLDDLEQYPCYGGLDLASTTDIAAFRLVWDVDGILYTHGWRWVPTDAVLARTERGTVPYSAWVETGALKTTEGNTIDYDVIQDDLMALYKRFNIQNIGYDKWNATNLVTSMVSEGLPMVEFIQGPKSYHPAMQSLERRYLAGKVAHGGDPVLHWCASNLITRQDANLNMAPDKKKAVDKIDDMVALLMAVGIAESGESTEPLSPWEDEGFSIAS